MISKISKEQFIMQTFSLKIEKLLFSKILGVIIQVLDDWINLIIFHSSKWIHVFFFFFLCLYSDYLSSYRLIIFARMVRILISKVPTYDTDSRGTAALIINQICGFNEKDTNHFKRFALVKSISFQLLCVKSVVESIDPYRTNIKISWFKDIKDIIIQRNHFVKRM